MTVSGIISFFVPILSLIHILYPNKKGKAQVSETQKKRLLTIGESALVKAIERYKTALLQDGGWRKPQNGSTFFNSGYVDYLDENYEPYSFATEGAKSIGEYESEFDRRIREAKERGETLPDDEQFDFWQCVSLSLIHI